MFMVCVWSLQVFAAEAVPTNTAAFSYIHDELKQGPCSVHVFKAARSHRDWELQTTFGGGTCQGMAVVSEQVKSMPPAAGHPVAAINGDFFSASRIYPGDPQGLQIVRGELTSGPNPTRVCFWTDAAGNYHRSNVTASFTVTWPDGTTMPFGLNKERAAGEAVLFTTAIGLSTRAYHGRELILERNGTNCWLPLQIGRAYTARVRAVREVGDTPTASDIVVLSLGPRLAVTATRLAPGATLQISTATIPDLAGARTAIGGGPSLVIGGKARQWGVFQLRHPRSAIGWNKDFFFLVEADGRQSESVGMSYAELAEYMVKLGCEEAMNLDGGGSATLWAYGNVVNNPSQGGERPGANALAVVLKNQAQR